MEAKIKRQAQQKRPVVANCSRVQRSEVTTDYLLVDINLSGMLSVVMVNDCSDFQHNYFSVSAKFGLLYFK